MKKIIFGCLLVAMSNLSYAQRAAYILSGVDFSGAVTAAKNPSTVTTTTSTTISSAETIAVRDATLSTAVVVDTTRSTASTATAADAGTIAAPIDTGVVATR